MEQQEQVSTLPYRLDPTPWVPMRAGKGKSIFPCIVSFHQYEDNGHLIVGALLYRHARLCVHTPYGRAGF
jgi:hypothetical protein